MKIGICGHFALGVNLVDGQTVKSNNVVAALEKNSEISLKLIDTYHWKKKPVKLLMQCVKGIATCDAIVFLTAHAGVQVFTRVFALLNRHYQKKIFYIVIGGWLPSLCREQPRLCKLLTKLNCIFVETRTMKNALEKCGLTNVVILNNFRMYRPLPQRNYNMQEYNSIRLCIFSRIMQQKGIEDAVFAIQQVNTYYGKAIYSLDLYGPVDKNYKLEFQKLSQNFPKYITYQGIAEQSKALQIISHYDAVMFPTRFFTEGIPGTVVDAFFAGVPVLSSRWESYSELITEGVEGYTWEFGNNDALIRLLFLIAEQPKMIRTLQKNCSERAIDFEYKTATKCFLEEIKRK